ncbi:MAG TPA: tyrosine-type recombinase/integrase [Polyangia bacterium]|nr:tyrosine-type recombinase/integrase [Polyangia bacterium]
MEFQYIPWARAHLDPRTFDTRAGYLAILAQDLAGISIDGVERVVDDLIARWRVEGCRFVAKVDRLGRTMNRKPRPISDSGINERLKVLKAVLGHAYITARVLPNRARIQFLKIKRAGVGDAEPVRYFIADERVRFLRYSMPGTADVFEIGRLTGMRPDELFHLLVGSVDLKARKIWVQASPCPLCPDGKWIPKTGTYRGIDICEALLPILRRLTKGRPDGALLIESNHGAPYWRRRGGGGRFAKTLRRAGLDRRGLSIYSLRHTFASDLVSAGRPLQEVAALLGNSVRTCEHFYAHLQPGRTREAVKVLKAAEPWGTRTVAPQKPKRHGTPVAANNAPAVATVPADEAPKISPLRIDTEAA